MNNLSPSNDCVMLVKHFEGCSLTVYEDAASLKTIGWGHKLRPSEMWIKSVTQEIADHMLTCDLQEAANGVSSLLRIIVLQCEFDALVSFTFNLGIDRLRESTLLRLINGGKFDAAMEEWLKWNHAGGKVCAGLVARRNAEVALFKGTQP